MSALPYQESTLVLTLSACNRTMNVSKSNKQHSNTTPERQNLVHRNDVNSHSISSSLPFTIGTEFKLSIGYRLCELDSALEFLTVLWLPWLFLTRASRHLSSVSNDSLTGSLITRTPEQRMRVRSWSRCQTPRVSQDQSLLNSGSMWSLWEALAWCIQLSHCWLGLVGEATQIGFGYDLPTLTRTYTEQVDMLWSTSRSVERDMLSKASSRGC
jgi:hypothetical protein